jgi:hypothetical protein
MQHRHALFELCLDGGLAGGWEGDGAKLVSVILSGSRGSDDGTTDQNRDGETTSTAHDAQDGAARPSLSTAGLWAELSALSVALALN